MWNYTGEYLPLIFPLKIKSFLKPLILIVCTITPLTGVSYETKSGYLDPELFRRHDCRHEDLERLVTTHRVESFSVRRLVLHLQQVYVSITHPAEPVPA
jgi:hypothetical protein